MSMSISMPEKLGSRMHRLAGWKEGRKAGWLIQSVMLIHHGRGADQLTR